MSIPWLPAADVTTAGTQPHDTVAEGADCRELITVPDVIITVPDLIRSGLRTRSGYRTSPIRRQSPPGRASTFRSALETTSRSTVGIQRRAPGARETAIRGRPSHGRANSTIGAAPARRGVSHQHKQSQNGT
jgi:hypothetical protein